MQKHLFVICFLFCSAVVFSQNTIAGKILNENNQELIPGEREHDDFMDMQYQCSGESCSEEP
jgi:hypothetical protein